MPTRKLSSCAILGPPKTGLLTLGHPTTCLLSDLTSKNYIAYAELSTDNTMVLGDGSTQLRVLGKGTIMQWVELTPHHHAKMILEGVLHVNGIKH